MQIIDQIKEEGYVLISIGDTSISERINKCILATIGSDTDFLCSLDRLEWHDKVYKCQTHLNESGALADLIEKVGPNLEAIFRDRLAWVNVLKLRAVRPSSRINGVDHVPFHRESLYAVTPSQVKHQYNIWIPCTESATLSGLSYFPKSHLINDSDLSIISQPDHPCKVDRFSHGHAIGFPYMPKSIENLPSIQSKRIEVPVGSLLLFSAMLIHGNGINHGGSIRYSVDTGVISNTVITENQPLHAAGGKAHYLTH